MIDFQNLQHVYNECYLSLVSNHLAPKTNTSETVNGNQHHNKETQVYRLRISQVNSSPSLPKQAMQPHGTSVASLK